MATSLGVSSLPPTPILSRMKTRVRQKCALTRVQRPRLERPPLPKKQKKQRPRRKRSPQRKRKKHRENGERPRNRRLNPKPRTRGPRNINSLRNLRHALGDAPPSDQGPPAHHHAT